MGKVTLRTLNNYLKRIGRSETEECARKGKTYYWLHICKNNNPVPCFYSNDAAQVLKEIKVRL